MYLNHLDEEQYNEVDNGENEIVNHHGQTNSAKIISSMKIMVTGQFVIEQIFREEQYVKIEVIKP